MPDDSNIAATPVVCSFTGFYKIWRTHKETGASELLVDKKNMILYQGMTLLAKAFAGVRYANISHMYIGYKTTDDISGFVPPTIDKSYTNKFEDYNVAPSLADLGYLRLPINFSPTFNSAGAGHEDNVPIFTNVITANNSTAPNGAAFNDSGDAEPSHIFEIALVAALDPTSDNDDLIFSRANFEPIVYDPAYNLTISWGIQFLTPSA